MLAWAAALGLVAGEAPAAPPPVPGSAWPLQQAEIDALRTTLYRVNQVAFEQRRDDAIAYELRIGFPSLTEDSLRRIDAALREDPSRRREAYEVLEVRLRWSRRPSERFLFFWEPRQRDEQGAASRAPTGGEARALDDTLAAWCARLGVELPAQVPYRVDLGQEEARVFPRHDLRWGVTTRAVVDEEAVARLVLSELGDVPYLVEALARVEAGCRGDASCEARLEAEARQACRQAGYVPLLLGLEARSLAGPADPAQASALLVVLHLRRVHPPTVLAELIRAVAQAGSRGPRAAAVARVARQSPRAIDREIQRALAAPLPRP
jgi:hypothetical protein